MSVKESDRKYGAMRTIEAVAVTLNHVSCSENALVSNGISECSSSSVRPVRKTMSIITSLGDSVYQRLFGRQPWEIYMQ